MHEALFSLEGNTLIVHTDLQAEDEQKLREFCRQLLMVDEQKITVDLSVVTYVHSLTIGTFSYLWLEALNGGKEVTFVVSMAIAGLLERTGLAKVFDYRIAE